MAVRSGDGLYWKTGLDTTGLKKGAVESKSIIKTLSQQITGLDVFAGLGIAAAAAFTKITAEAWKMSKDLQLAMKEVQTISGAAQENFEGMTESVVELSKKVPDSATQLSKALYQIVSAGYDGAEGLNLLEVASKAAVAGVTDTITAADGLTTVMNAWKYSSEDATRVADIMFQTVKLGKTNFGELSGSISNVAALAASSGVSFEEISAAVATLTKQGVPTTQAMTQIRSAMIGVTETLGDGWAEAMTLQEAFIAVEESAGGSQNELKNLVGRIEGVNAVLGLTGDNAQMAADDLDAMKNSAGASADAFNIMIVAARNQIKIFKNIKDAELLKYGDKLVLMFGKIAASINTKQNIKNLEEQGRKVRSLVYELSQSETPLEKRNQIYEELKKISPDIVSGIDTEAISVDTLNKNLSTYNETLATTIALETLNKEERKAASKEATKQLKEAKIKEALHEAITRSGLDLSEFTGTLEENANKAIEALHKIAQTEVKPKHFDPDTGVAVELLGVAGTLEGEISSLLGNLKKSSIKTDEAESEAKSIRERTERIRELLLSTSKGTGKVPGGATTPSGEDDPIILDVEELEKEINTLKSAYDDIKFLQSQGFEIEGGALQDILGDEKSFKDYLNRIFKDYQGYADQINTINLELAEIKEKETEKSEKQAETYKVLGQRIQSANSKMIERQTKTIFDDAAEDTDEIIKDLEVVEEKLKILGKEFTPEEWENLVNATEELSYIVRDVGSIIGRVDDDLGEVIYSVGEAISGISKLAAGDYVGGALDLLSTVVTVIASIIETAKETDAAAKARTIERMENAVDSLNRKLEDHIELLGKINSTEWLKGGEDMIESMNGMLVRFLTNMENIPLQVEEVFLISGKSRVREKDIDTSDFTIQDWQNLLDTNQNLTKETRDVVQQYIDDYKEISGQIIDLEEDMKRLITGIDKDGIIDVIVDGFEAGKRSAADFAETFEDLMRDAMMQTFKDRYLLDQIDAWYDMLYEKSKPETVTEEVWGVRGEGVTTREVTRDGEITPEEIEDLQAAWDDIMSQAAVGWEAIEEFLGETIDGYKPPDKEGLAGAIKGITEDTAGILAGQVTGMRFNMLEQLEVSQNSLNTLNRIATNTSHNVYIKNLYELMKQRL